MGDHEIHSCPTEVVIPSDQAEVRRVQQQIETFLVAFNYTEHDIFGIKLALEEALVNAIKHGNQLDRSKSVRVVFQVHADRFHVHITDEGGGFNPDDLPDPTAPENLERPCGRGVMLMRYYMSEVFFNERGNNVTMTKLRNGQPGSQG
jgi:serine/threonine-protein kinase RsbW